jgi:hypothetical protein
MVVGSIRAASSKHAHPARQTLRDVLEHNLKTAVLAFP